MNKRVSLFAPRGFEDINVADFTDGPGRTIRLKEVTPVDLVRGMHISVRGIA